MLLTLRSFAFAMSLQANQPAECDGVPGTKAGRASPNDNRVAGGALTAGVLTIRLTMREAAWHPDGPNGCGLRVHAFAEDGKPAQVPGPLIRVPVGTEVRVILRNSLGASVRVRGLVERPAEWHTIGSARAQLAMDSAAANDRVFVMTHTRYPGTRTTEEPGTAREVNGINGLSWPHSERISATVGDTVRWRILNPAATSHVMHLHGFYYRILQRGGVSAFDSAFAPAQQDFVVSEFMAPNRTMTMTWVPERPGNWLFHCHFLVHMTAGQRVARAFGSRRPDGHSHAAHHDSAMAGPIVGIAVRPKTGAASAPGGAPQRRLRLYANERPGVFGDRPGLGFVLQSGTVTPANDSVRIPGSPLILTRGERTQITVMNRLRVPLGVHWHGMELESYFDGVPGVSGRGGRLAPAVQPGDSFVVNMTPPRAGTFMYHVHSEQLDELNSGLYGALIVLPEGEKWEPDRDHAFVISNGGPGDSHATIFVNGSAAPAPIEMRQGVTQRLRFMSIPANGEFVVRLLDDTTQASWRQIARDGADLPADRVIETRAQTRVDVGITKDFEFTPARPGGLILEVTHRVRARPTRVPIRVH